MKMPRADPAAVARFEALVKEAPGATVRPMFGQPAAFIQGAMFLGVFGDVVFLRLAETDRAAARRIPGVGSFEPMPGRPMTEYVTLPAALLADHAAAVDWLGRSLRYAKTVKAKPASKRSAPKRR